MSRIKRALTVPAESICELMTRSPETYAKIIEFLEQGHSPGGVAALTGTHIQTVRVCREMAAGAIHATIRKMGYDITEAAQKAASRLAEEIDRMPLEKLPAALAILLDKSLILNGQATARLEIEHSRVPSREQLMQMFDKLAQKADAREISSGEGSS